MEISGSTAFLRFLFKRFILELAGEQLGKTFIYYDNKLFAFICYTQLKLLLWFAVLTVTTDYYVRCHLVNI